VRFELGDGAERVAELGRFDLIFADAPGGKLENLDGAVAALQRGGLLVVDDMDLVPHQETGLAPAIEQVRARIAADPRLLEAELAFASGVMIATRVR
jgi:predicted O-methyltransferase YrrM